MKMKLMGYTLVAVTSLALVATLGCAKKKPGPITADVSIVPSPVQSGSLITFTVGVTNVGGKVTISKIHAREECIGGRRMSLS
jgi:hypothetical protein